MNNMRRNYNRGYGRRRSHAKRGRLGIDKGNLQTAALIIVAFVAGAIALHAGVINPTWLEALR